MLMVMPRARSSGAYNHDKFWIDVIKIWLHHFFISNAVVHRSASTTQPGLPDFPWHIILKGGIYQNTTKYSK
jgi:hypothetical protein